MCTKTCGVFFVDVAAKEMWLEVHKLPKENWLSEIDTIVQALKKREEKKEKEEQAMSEVVSQSLIFSSRFMCSSFFFFL